MITRTDKTNAYGHGARTLVILAKVRKLQNVPAAEAAVAAAATEALVGAAS